jgi:hypothetical protein
VRHGRLTGRIAARDYQVFDPDQPVGNYVTAHFFDDGSGTIDLAQEIKPDLNSFALDGGDGVHVKVTGTGRMLWFFPTNKRAAQDDSVRAQP